MTKAQLLENVLLQYAETERNQAICNEISRRMVADGLTEKEIELQIATAIHDGLAYGNWVWDYS